jgi:hypothetical protein
MVSTVTQDTLNRLFMDAATIAIAAMQCKCALQMRRTTGRQTWRSCSRVRSHCRFRNRDT